MDPTGDLRSAAKVQDPSAKITSCPIERLCCLSRVGYNPTCLAPCPRCGVAPAAEEWPRGTAAVWQQLAAAPGLHSCLVAGQLMPGSHLQPDRQAA